MQPVMNYTGKADLKLRFMRDPRPHVISVQRHNIVIESQGDSICISTDLSDASSATDIDVSFNDEAYFFKVEYVISGDRNSFHCQQLASR